MKLAWRPKAALVLPLAVLAVASLVALNEMGYRRSADAALSMAREQEKRTVLHALLQEVLDAETGQRGFLLTGRPQYLEPYDTATARLGSSLAALRDAARGAPWLQAETTALSAVAEQKVEELEQTISLARAGNRSGALEILATDRGRVLMEIGRAHV